jgi:predicted ATPase/DNA-binding SARP family transcriptional activator
VGLDRAAADTPNFEFGILGPLQARRAGAEVPLGARKQRAVLALLLLEAGRVFPTDRLIEELWQGRPPPSAPVTLRSYVSRLRALLRPDVDVMARAGGYALEAAALHVDARRFERLVREGEDALAHGLTRTAAERLRSGLALWRGRALADVADDGLLALESSRLEELRLSAIEGRIEAELALGLHAELIGELERLVGEHPFRERIWRQLMLALYRCDRQADALAAYARMREVLTTELGLEPSEDLRRLQQAVLGHDVPTVPRAREQHNLPVPLSSFIGRERELEEVEQLLRESRLLTVTGVGGVGKTRLALAAAERAMPRFGRAYFADLSGVRDSTVVSRAVADALRIPESPHRHLLEVLIGYLRTTEPLLVLDNCEHLREACTDLVEPLLESVPSLHVLATSREALGAAGEVEYALPPLAIPEDDLRTEELGRFPSVQLFLQRASATRTAFDATPDALSAIARICRDLDGLPLAIELAAVRAKSLSPEEIAAHLDQRFDFLKFWRQVAVPRHQTLRATMDWSYDLLSEREQQTLRQLSVFAGGFTLDACAHVCTEGDESQALDLLARLVDRSLVIAEPGEDGSRYRLLETVRQYAAERLVTAGEAESTRHAHAEAFLHLAEEAFSPGQDGLSILAREQGNLRAALEWSFSTTAEIGPRLTRALGRFWHARGQLSEARRWLERALALHQQEDSLGGELLGLLGAVMQDSGDLTAAEKVLREALRIADSARDPTLAAALRVPYAEVRLLRGEMGLADALSDCEDAAATLEAAEEVDRVADALVVMGRLRFWLADRAADQQTLERAAALARESGNRPAELRALEWLAISSGDLRVATDVAIARQEELLAQVAGEPRVEAGILVPLAWQYGSAGRFADARSALARSRAILAGDFGWTLEWTAGAMNAGSIELMAGDAVAAERELRPAYDSLRGMRETGYLVVVGYFLASSLYEQGRYDEAQQVVEEIWRPSSDDPDKVSLLLVAAKVQARRGNVDAAERLIGEARRDHATTHPMWVGEALLAEGEILELGGKLEKASTVFEAALALYEGIRAVPLAERARTALERLNERLTPAR